MEMARFDKIGWVILVLGLIVLFFSSFGGLKINLIVPTFLLIIGLYCAETKNLTNQIRKSLERNHPFLIMIGSLVLGLFCSSFLMLLALTNVQWNEIYYFSPDILSKLLSNDNEFPNFGLLLGLIFSSTLLIILSR